MENKVEKANGKVSKKALRSLLKDSVKRSLGELQLPEPNKKVRKIISRSAKKMASVYSSVLKKEMKRSKPKKSKLEPQKVAQVA